MWPRKQLDIDWRDILFGLRCMISPSPRPADEDVVPSDWIPPRESLVTLSVRTGWDLLLTALDLPPGSEILVSGVTIPDMVRIIEHHGLVAVPIDVDADRLEPALDDLERAVTPRTRAILVAHLFGARIDMEPIIRFARQYDLAVVEDCAQAFVGRGYAGHDGTDASLFSFGPIKTATALGGAVLRVRDADVRKGMIALEKAYPIQSHGAFAKRLAKYGAFRVLGWPWAFGLLVRTYRLFGVDYDRKLGSAAHSFPGAEFFQQIRHQPCAALVRLLQRRLETFETRGGPRLRRRTNRGNQLAAVLPAGMVVGGQNESHTYWVMPLRVANVAEVLAALQRAGFDATSRSSLIVVAAQETVARSEPECASWLAETIFLPNGHDIPDSEWTRVSIILGNVARVAATPPKREPVANVRVSVPS
jgi:dTDP-4-amino-4,6-dideoxygalactose transaminase